MQHRPRKKSSYQATTLIAVVLLLLILFISVAYFFVIPEPGQTPEQQRLLTDLAANRGRWEASRPASFRYVVERDCFCSDEYRIPYVVTEDRGYQHAEYLTSVVPHPSGTPVTPPDIVWLDGMFDIVAAAAAGTDPVDVIFDARFGYPSRITISSVHGARRVSTTYRVRDFEVIAYE